MATKKKPTPNRYRLTKPEHGSQEWLTMRFMDSEGRKRISASAAAAIYNLHRFVPSDKYAAELLSDTPPVPTEPTWAMTRGNDLEPLCIKWANDRLGIEFITPEELFCYDDPQGARLISTLDGFYEDKNNRAVLEIKTYNRTWMGELPDYWRIQGIQQAICADVDVITWAVFDSSLSLHIHTQQVSDDEKQEHITKASEWLSAIDMGMTPPGVTWSFASIQERYPEPLEDDLVETDQSHMGAVQELREVRAQLKELEAREDELKAHLCELIGEHEGLSIGGTTVATWKGQSRSSFDSKSLKADHPNLAEKYTRNITVRTFLLKGK